MDHSLWFSPSLPEGLSSNKEAFLDLLSRNNLPSPTHLLALIRFSVLQRFFPDVMFLKEIDPEYSLEGLMLKLKLQSLAT